MINNPLHKSISSQVTVQLQPASVEHFKLYYYAAVVRVIERLSQSFETGEACFERFPFLAGYNNELAENGLAGITLGEASDWWRDALLEWEKKRTDHLPLRALRETSGLDYNGMTTLMTIGLIEEDNRFAQVFDATQGATGQHRLTLGTLQSWGQEDADWSRVRADVRRLQDLGLVQVVNPEAPRLEWALQVPGLIWDALGGKRSEEISTWATYHEHACLQSLDDLILPDRLQNDLVNVPRLLSSSQVKALIVRGPQHNGRRTMLGAIAAACGYGLLEISGVKKPDDERWKQIGPLATLLHAMPAVVLDLLEGETVELPVLNAYEGPVGVALGRLGAVSGPSADRALTFTLAIPDPAARLRHWCRATESNPPEELDRISNQFRMTSGNIHRSGDLAKSYAALAGRGKILATDVQQANRTLRHQGLGMLATRMNSFGDWSCLAVNTQTLSDLHSLETRCRHRERLRTAVGATLGEQLNPGVRAMFTGPSGTGKTLAASLLASVLQMDLYRLDISSVVNKYIGETEKNLHQLFSLAEELDVMLLIDEGDSLLTQRTKVQTSNDRYANLETNFLLQRIESFEGIVIVTTNSSNNIDSAFQRRMDAVVDFRSPDVAERWMIWQMHLPPTHAVPQDVLGEIAERCPLSGGQIRNAVLHASLLALNNGGLITSEYIEAGVHREYRKSAAVCPLRRTQVVDSGM
jgi:hypothetical protein